MKQGDDYDAPSWALGDDIDANEAIMAMYVGRWCHWDLVMFEKKVTKYVQILHCS